MVNSCQGQEDTKVESSVHLCVCVHVPVCVRTHLSRHACDVWVPMEA